MKNTAILTLFSLALATASAPAGAVNLTGIWSGQFKCSGFNGKKFSFVQKNQSLNITQNGNAIAVNWFDGATLASQFSGFALENQKSPDAQGRTAIANCAIAPDLTSGFSEIVNLDARVNSAKGTGSLTGTSIYVNDGLEITQCRWTFKRIDAADPNVPMNCS